MTSNLKTLEVKIVCLPSQRSSDISEPKTSQVNKCVSSIPKGSALQNPNSLGGHLHKNHSNRCADEYTNVNFEPEKVAEKLTLFIFPSSSSISQSAFSKEDTTEKMKKKILN